MLCGRKKTSPDFPSGMGVSRWWLHFHSWLNCSFNICLERTLIKSLLLCSFPIASSAADALWLISSYFFCSSAYKQTNKHNHNCNRHSLRLLLTYPEWIFCPFEMMKVEYFETINAHLKNKNSFHNIKGSVLNVLCVVLLRPQSPRVPPRQIQSGALRAPGSHSPDTDSSRPSDRNVREAVGECHSADSRCRGEDPPGGGFEIWRSPGGVWDGPRSKKPGMSGRILVPCWGCPCRSHIAHLLCCLDSPSNSPHCYC